MSVQLDFDLSSEETRIKTCLEISNNATSRLLRISRIFSGRSFSSDEAEQASRDILTVIEKVSSRLVNLT